MRYFDTSFLAPLIREEATSVQVEAFMAALPVSELAVSRWTLVEFASLLAHDVRMGVITGAQADDAGVLFRDIVERSFRVVSPTAEDFDVATRYIGHHESGLRAGDALHLAIAGNNGAQAIYTLDRTMLRAGRLLGLPTDSSILID